MNRDDLEAELARLHPDAFAWAMAADKINKGGGASE
jgi:hypothetical protein